MRIKSIQLFYTEYAELIKFLVLFVGAFCLLYFSSLFLLGAADPKGAVYWPNFTRLFNVFGWLAWAIIWVARHILLLFGFENTLQFFNRLQLGRTSVTVSSVCLGYGVMSFWVAFVVANRVPIKYCLIWIFTGLTVIILINSCRVAIIAVAVHKHWFMGNDFGHAFYHDSFTVAAYIGIGILIWRFFMWDKKYMTGVRLRKNTRTV